MNRYVIISGCSGGGKSTLLAELSSRGHATVAEPGRRIVEDELRSGGSALPWIDLEAFARRAIEMSLEDREAAGGMRGWVFFDRGLIDAAVALQHVSGQPVVETLGRQHRYYHRVFLAPPWPEIYRADDGRRHQLGDAIKEYDRLLTAYPQLGYDVVILPKTGVGERADFVLSRLADA